MRISDWSSDVCSSDLLMLRANAAGIQMHAAGASILRVQGVLEGIIATTQDGHTLAANVLRDDMLAGAGKYAFGAIRPAGNTIECAGAHACCQHKMAGPYWFGQARPRNGVTPPDGIPTFDGAGKQHRHTRALRTERTVIDR